MGNEPEVIQAFNTDRFHLALPELCGIIRRRIQRRVKSFFSFCTCSMSVLPSYSHEYHVLEELAHGREPLCQWCLLALDVCYCIVEFATDPVGDETGLNLWERKSSAAWLCRKAVRRLTADRLAGSDPLFLSTQ